MVSADNWRREPLPQKPSRVLQNIGVGATNSLRAVQVRCCQPAVAGRQSTMSTAQREFGQRLRNERERNGVALRTIADSTKIPLSLLTGLERGEIDKWPGGLFGRAHLRAYADAVGLPAEQVVLEFRWLSGDSSNGTTPARSHLPPTPGGNFRLTLAEDRRGIHSLVNMRGAATAMALCVIFAVAMALARVLQVNLAVMCALVAFTSYALAAMVRKIRRAYSLPEPLNSSSSSANSTLKLVIDP